MDYFKNIPRDWHLYCKIDCFITLSVSVNIMLWPILIVDRDTPIRWKTGYVFEAKKIVCFCPEAVFLVMLSSYPAVNFINVKRAHFL